MLSSHLILCHPLLLLPPIPPSIRVFSNESTLRMRGPSIGVSASASVLPMNTQDWSPLGWSGWISLQSILKEISPRCSLEGMMLKLKLQYFGHLMWGVDSLKKTDGGRDWGQEKGTTEDEMAGWHHRLDAHEFGWTPGVGDRQGGLACCNSWGCKESDTTEWLTWTEYSDHLTFHCLVGQEFLLSSNDELWYFFSTLEYSS